MGKFVSKEKEKELRDEVRKEWEKEQLKKEIKKIKKDEERRLEAGPLWRQAMKFGFHGGKQILGSKKKR